MEKKKYLNSKKDNEYIMGKKLWQVIGLGVVGGILITIGALAFMNWLSSNFPWSINPLIGAISLIIGFGAISYAKYGNF